jgi:hypothetical protein
MLFDYRRESGFAESGGLDGTPRASGKPAPMVMIAVAALMIVGSPSLWVKVTG